MYNWIVNLLFFSSLFILMSCKGDTEETEPFPGTDDDYKIVIETSREQPGLGESGAYPLGQPLKLPEGIRLVQRRHHKFDPDISKLYAHTNFFYVDVNLVNDRMSGTPPVTVEFPAGLIVVSMDHDKQNGISIERFLVPVPPTERIGGGRDTTTIYIGMACLNEKRSMPWYDNEGEEQRYPISRNNFQDFLITNDKNLLQFIDMVTEHPKLRITRHWDPVEAHEPDYVTPEWMKIHSRIQGLIWQITDGHGIRQGEITALKQELLAYK
ncbi:hypothetical protein [Sphingobacterium gobiense]|uniref:Uncharacterized protein n=1 Tax=Sphingobacterium gobiense TaxID=1382456 RepID=A0A2S9JM00_9SPHI|nr:hypothetical protein [Sphingobacterium gobiense]PRD54138.1 hypothetical protein C5749_11660 [Sphingobacterium gobiense]